MTKTLVCSSIYSKMTISHCPDLMRNVTWIRFFLADVPSELALSTVRAVLIFLSKWATLFLTFWQVSSVLAKPHYSWHSLPLCIFTLRVQCFLVCQPVPQASMLSVFSPDGKKITLLLSKKNKKSTKQSVCVWCLWQNCQIFCANAKSLVLLLLLTLILSFWCLRSWQRGAGLWGTRCTAVYENPA